MKLEELLGSELYAQVKAKIDEKNASEPDKLKHVRYADLSEGEYVGKGKYDTEMERLNNIISGKDTELTSANDLIAQLKKDSKGNEDMQGKITAYEGQVKDLQKQLDCNVIHMDDFYLQPHQRTTKRLREPGGNVDYERFETEVLQPMLTGEAFSYRPYDAHAVCFLPEVIVSPKKVTIIEGSYACHPRLRRSYDLRIFLTVDRQEQLERIRKRNGEEREEMFERIWIPLEERYFWKAGVEKTCDISLDTTGLFEG